MKKGMWLKRLVLTFAVLAVQALPLVVQGGVAAKPEKESSVTIAVTGDIIGGEACKAVSDAILSNAFVKVVLLVGDTSNSSDSSLEKYNKIYKGTYDRFLDRIRPAPGNHDKPFTGYCAFWKSAAHAPELYYSFDLGGWHFISLNSLDLTKNIKQIAWLKKDLAARPGVPVIAYWHHPYFSTAKHGGSKSMKPLWEALYAHGPALVFCGHRHGYERFDPLDPEGKPASPAKGIREFVVSPGGASPDKEQDADMQPPLPVLYHGDAQHVAFFTLSPDGSYRFVVKSIAEDGKVSEIDSGTGKLRK